MATIKSAFIPRRLISNNEIVAYEIVHHMKNRKRDRIFQMTLKLDMSKAYYRVKWDYLEGMMYKLGFPQEWVRLIMICVPSVSYSIVANSYHLMVIMWLV